MNEHVGDIVLHPSPSMGGGKLYAALAKAQAKMDPAILNKVNPHFRNKYADLNALRAATLPALTANGLCIIQYTSCVTGALFLHTRLAHESGEWIEGTYPLPIYLDKPQVLGSALTYARRYGWGAICGEAADEDDDANAATNGSAKLITAQQAAELDAEITAVGADYPKFLEFMKVTAIADIPASDLPKAKTALASKRKK